MVQDGSLELYIGGDETFKSHFEADRFGYFDLIDEIKQLGYVKWSRVAFIVPNSIKKNNIKDDKDVMLMLSYLELGICVLHVYVVGGELGEPQVQEADGSFPEEVDEPEEADGSFPEEVDEPGDYDGGDEDEDDNESEGQDQSEGDDDGPGMENGEDAGTGLEKGEERGDEEYEFDDGSYIPSTDIEEETYYSSLDGFISEDDEYIQSRDKFKKSNLRVITDDLFNGIVPSGGVKKTADGCGDSIM